MTNALWFIHARDINDNAVAHFWQRSRFNGDTAVVSNDPLRSFRIFMAIHIYFFQDVYVAEI